jgi:hypothetical protein
MYHPLILRAFASACPLFIRFLVFLFPIFLWADGLRAAGIFAEDSIQHTQNNCRAEFYISFPDDITVELCFASPRESRPEIFSKSNTYQTITYIDQVITSGTGVCLQIERTWIVTSYLCNDLVKISTYYVNNPTNTDIAPVLSPINAPLTDGRPTNKPPNITNWRPFGPMPAGRAQHYNNPKIFEFSTSVDLWDDAFGRYGDASKQFIYKQIITVASENSAVCNLGAQFITLTNKQAVSDSTNNSPAFWNDAAINFIEPYNGTPDQCEAPVDIWIDVTGMPSGSKNKLRYELLLDLDRDGDFETVVNSATADTVTPGMLVMGNDLLSEPDVMVQFDKRPTGSSRSNVDEPNNKDGTITVPADRYRFVLETRQNGNITRSYIRWQRANNDTEAFVIPLLPHGSFKVRWVLTDSCGNQRTFEHSTTIRDVKPPSILCKKGGTRILEDPYSGGVIVRVEDFIQSGEDNCTKSDLLQYSFAKGGDFTPTSKLVTTTEFGCLDYLWSQIQAPVYLCVRDLAGNISKCKTSVILRDPNNNCFASLPAITILGKVTTETQKPLEGTTLNIFYTGKEDYSRDQLQKYTLTDIGEYIVLFSYATNTSCTISFEKNDDPLNGVTTFDLALLSKHLLGIQSLTNPYKMIAADADKNGRLSNFDIVELRKLILGVYDNLPANQSWRFVYKAFNFPNPENPFATPFPETQTWPGQNQQRENQDVIAIKIGDLDDDAATNPLTKAETRTTGTLLFDVEDRALKAGEVATIQIKATEPVAGYQFTLNTPGLEVLDIAPGAGMTRDNFAVFAEKQALTTSFDGQEAGAFSMTVKSKTSGRLSQMLQLSNQITEAAAFTQQAEHWNVALRFNSKAGQSTVETGFELYQNAPNPWTDKTSISFYLPEPDHATLTIFDQTGRVLFVQKGAFPKGKNALLVDRTYLNQRGVLYYKLETTKHTATRKMMQK